MNTNVNLESAVGVLAFLGTAFVLGLATLIVLHALKTRKSGRATTALRPGESYTTDLVFDLPPDIKNPELLMREGSLVTHFIIGHENSFWHRKTKFRLES